MGIYDSDLRTGLRAQLLLSLAWLVPPLMLAFFGWWFFQPLGDLRWILFLGAAGLVALLTSRSGGLPRGRVLRPSEAPGLRQILDGLADRAGLRRSLRIVLLPGPLINAAASLEAGGTVYVTEGLLRHLSLRELQGVLAHEVSHLKHGDLWISRGIEMVLLGLQSLALGAFWMLPLTVYGELAVMAVGLGAPAVFRFFLLGFLRSREFAADQGAAGLTGDPEALASALARIEYRQGRPWWWPVPEVRMDRTHPDSSLRIRRLLAMERGWSPRPLLREVC